MQRISLGVPAYKGVDLLNFPVCACFLPWSRADGRAHTGTVCSTSHSIVLPTVGHSHLVSDWNTNSFEVKLVCLPRDDVLDIQGEGLEIPLEDNSGARTSRRYLSLIPLPTWPLSDSCVYSAGAHTYTKLSVFCGCYVVFNMFMACLGF